MTNDPKAQRQYQESMIEMSPKMWPKTGSKATFNGSTKFWFTNIIKDAKELLEVGNVYTIRKIELASSWCAVILEEFPDKKFALNWFTHDKDITTEEAMKTERESWQTLKHNIKEHE